MQIFTAQKQFPFKSVLTLQLLVEYWENAIQTGKVPTFAASLQEALDNAQELKGPIEDLAILEKHRDLINFLMTAAIPAAQSEYELTAATIPFQFKSIYSSNLLKRTFDFEGLDTARVNAPGNKTLVGKTIHACLLVLKEFYHVDIPFDKPILFTIPDKKTGLDKVYKVEIGRQFFKIVPKVEPKPIDAKVIKFLTEKVYDVDLLLQYIRPEDYEFHGFMIFHMVDMTEQEMVSSIKYDLLQKNAVTRKESFSQIQQKMRAIFGMPDIQLGIAFLDPNNNMITASGVGEESCSSLADSRGTNIDCRDYSGSIYERSWTEKRYITIEDLTTYPYQSNVEKVLLAKNVRSILLAPLIDDNETIGMLELATPTAGKLNPLRATKVESVLPMFTAAVKRVKEEMSTEVRAIIQEECTNIHPTVQWRFFQAGVNLMNKRRTGEKAALEDIVFNDVFPLFGLADVRNSSTERNAAIQHDLQQNLKLVKDLMQKINTSKKLPLLDETIYRTELQLQKINHGLASGDESNVLEFLKQEVNPIIQHFDGDAEFQKIIARYKNSLDPVFGVVYKQRKGFEESLSMINKMIGSYLDEVEDTAQQMFPHYFEKYQTDGIEYTLYLGSSLTRNKNFDPFYLKNFRLWQLLITCEIDRRMGHLKPRLKNNLDITQLILVHDQSLSIRFRPDEKQFDVDGAYDIRYEIVKKRIDKAQIKNTGERLTQPGKIAIVYNQAKIEEEYKRYFEYLIAKKLITPHVEELELEELPGATGLRALRVEILKENKYAAAKKDDLLRNIEEALSMQ
ncbi:MAG: GAF domain-containing protein [Bacteroidota bacterium]